MSQGQGRYVHLIGRDHRSSVIVQSWKHIKAGLRASFVSSRVVSPIPMPCLHQRPLGRVSSELRAAFEWVADQLHERDD